MNAELRRSKPLKTKVKAFIARRVVDQGVSRTALADAIGKSMSYLSQIESGTTHFPEALVSRYVVVLRLDAAAASELMALVQAQNDARRNQTPEKDAAELAALLRNFGDRINPEVIRELIERVQQDLKRQQILAYKKFRGPSGGGRMEPKRFCEIATRLGAFRDEAVGSRQRVYPITKAVEYAHGNRDAFDLNIYEKLPSELGNAYAAVSCEQDLWVMHVTEDFWRKAEAREQFSSHVVAHELAHALLEHGGVRKLDGTKTERGHWSAKLRDDDPAEELEAEIGAIMLQLHWRDLFSATPAHRDALIQEYRVIKDLAQQTYHMLQVPSVRGLLLPHLERG